MGLRSGFFPRVCLQEYVMGALGGKTVVLVTHQVEFLPAVDLILVMREGEMVQSGQYHDLLAEGTDFGTLVEAHNEAMDAVDNAGESATATSLSTATSAGTTTAEVEIQMVAAISPLAANTEAMVAAEVDRAHVTGANGANDGKNGTTNGESGASGTNGDADILEKRLVEEEGREEGAVGIGVYVTYLTQVWGGAAVPLLLLCQIVFQGAQVAGAYWLSYATTPSNGVEPGMFIRVYAYLVLGGVMFYLFVTAGANVGGIVTANRFFMNMLRSLFRAPMSFFDTTPTGRILSRVSLPGVCGIMLLLKCKHLPLLTTRQSI